MSYSKKSKICFGLNLRHKLSLKKKRKRNNIGRKEWKEERRKVRERKEGGREEGRKHSKVESLHNLGLDTSILN